MCRGQAGELKGRFGHAVDELALFEGAGDRRYRALAFGGIEFVDQEELQADRIDQAERGRDRRFRRGAIDDDTTPGMSLALAARSNSITASTPRLPVICMTRSPTSSCL